MQFCQPPAKQAQTYWSEPESTVKVHQWGIWAKLEMYFSKTIDENEDMTWIIASYHTKLEATQILKNKTVDKCDHYFLFRLLEKNLIIFSLRR